MKSSNRKQLLLPIATAVVVYAYFVLLLWWLGTDNFCYREQLSTFYYNKALMLDVFERPGGLCGIIGKFIEQFFLFPTAALLINAAVFFAITKLNAVLIRRVSGIRTFTPLALGTSVSLLILQYNVNFSYSSTISMLMLLIVLCSLTTRDGRFRGASRSTRILSALAATVFLYATASAMATLFSILVLMLAILREPRNVWYYFACPVVVMIMGYASYRSGVASSLGHMIMPQAYFTARLHAPGYIAMPWLCLAVSMAVACIVTYFKPMSTKVRRIIFASLLIAEAVFAIVAAREFIRPENEMFKTLNCQIREQRWDDVIATTQKADRNNLLVQNCLNMALAEKGLLADSLFSHPCYDIRSIYITGDSRPYIYMLLSDVYYSMGHMALARRHAFEANQSLVNRSPRMFQRLADTNIAFGNYKVAEKYINILSTTLFYRDWAEQRRKLLNDAAVAADPEMSAKRACIFPDNRFSAIKGLDDDLKQVIRANPSHKPTIQYLGSLYLLSKDIPSFMEVINEFAGTEALPLPLPKYFQQGVVASKPENPDSVYAALKIDPETINQYNTFKKNTAQNRQNLWYFLRYTN